jgi:hypothetical protein
MLSTSEEQGKVTKVSGLALQSNFGHWPFVPYATWPNGRTTLWAARLGRSST